LLKPTTQLWHDPTAIAKIGTMPEPAKAHPDRVAATLANLDAASLAQGPGPHALPGAGAADCRIDLKLLQHRALAAVARSPAAAAHLAPFAGERHPDLWAGTVQDGTARGFAARLEEAIALAPPAGAVAARPGHRSPRTGGGDALAGLLPGRVTTGKELRKRKDVLLQSSGARLRFTRREGLLFVEREGGLHASNCLRFEARTDHGTLDGFVGAVDERPRLFSAQFLQPVRLEEADTHTELEAAGRLGRGPVGWNVRLWLRSEPTWRHVELRLAIEQRLVGWRLRARFLGVPSAAIEHDCTPVREVVANTAGGFVAFTLVRACDRLLVDGTPVATPGAACRGELVHTFRLGGAPA
jgi:hypothetical protein